MGAAGQIVDPREGADGAEAEGVAVAVEAPVAVALPAAAAVSSSLLPIPAASLRRCFWGPPGANPAPRGEVATSLSKRTPSLCLKILPERFGLAADRPVRCSLLHH